jgi:hypothetical protein
LAGTGPAVPQRPRSLPAWGVVDDEDGDRSRTAGLVRNRVPGRPQRIGLIRRPGRRTVGVDDLAGVDHAVDHAPGPGRGRDVDGEVFDPAAEVVRDRPTMMTGEDLIDRQVAVRRVQDREADGCVETEQCVEQPLGLPRAHRHPFGACFAARL